jgi:large repetitive protein
MRFIRVVIGVCLVALVVVPTALALRFTDESYNPPVGETGKPYPNWSFTGAGGCGPALPYTFRLLNSSAPPGLTIDSSGLVHGIPTQTGDFSFWLELSDENPPSASWCRPESAQRQFTIHIVPGLNIVQKQSSLGGAFLNQPYNFQLTATGGGTLTWSVLSGALPAGLGLNSSTGAISGTPTATGDFTFKIQVKDTGTRSDSQTYTLSIVQQLLISAKNSVGEVGLPYQLAPTATGGRPGYSWSLDGGTALPAGLVLDAATGAISGTPTTAGKTAVKLAVTDTLGLKKTLDLSLNVVARLLLVKKALPSAKVGSAYSVIVAKSGGARPFKWAVLGATAKRTVASRTKVAGGLPKGVKLNPRTGQLSGTPTKAGTYRFRLQVTDALGAVSTRSYLLKVQA